MAVPMIDLQAQYASIQKEIDDAVHAVFAAQTFRGGPAVEEFEAAVAQYTGVKHALGVASGTDALLLPLKALGLEAGDEVITTPFSFFATAGAIVNAGLKPVFVDIQPESFNIDPALIEAAITPRTRAIMPVHLYGQCADMDAILGIAERHTLQVIEDNAQALGATTHGRPAGSMGIAGALSFYPTKNLGAAGEGGMVLTNDDEIARVVRMLRCHGSNQSYAHEIVGMNSHLHSVQAAVLGAKLPHLSDWNARRIQHATAYDAAFAELDGITTPAVSPGNTHVYHQYVLRIRERDAASALLKTRNIGHGIFYPRPLHLQPCFAEIAAGTYCPESERASAEVLALPIFPEMTEHQQREVIDALTEHLS